MKYTIVSMTLLALTLFPTTAIGVQLSGSQTASFTAYIHGSITVIMESNSEGPTLLGWIPQSCVSEFATASSTIEYVDNMAYPVPVPQFEDGTYATEEEILFAVQWGCYAAELFVVDFEANATWNGGPDVYLGVNNSVGVGVSCTITSYAFRQGSVGAAPLDFGTLKSMFE